MEITLVLPVMPKNRGKNVCDKCNQEVEPNNCAVNFSYLMDSESVEVLSAYLNGLKRHLFPMLDQNGTQICPGSPSRVRLSKNREGMNAEERKKLKKAQSVLKKMNEEFGPPNTVITV